MAAPDQCCTHVKKTLANSEPSTHGTKRTNSIAAAMSANDPKQTFDLQDRAVLLGLVVECLSRGANFGVCKIRAVRSN
jgi:hypothetical protein